jgi:hypothetical protein
MILFMHQKEAATIHSWIKMQITLIMNPIRDFTLSKIWIVIVSWLREVIEIAVVLWAFKTNQVLLGIDNGKIMSRCNYRMRELSNLLSMKTLRKWLKARELIIVMEVHKKLMLVSIKDYITKLCRSRNQNKDKTFQIHKNEEEIVALLVEVLQKT